MRKQRKEKKQQQQQVSKIEKDEKGEEKKAVEMVMKEKMRKVCFEPWFQKKKFSLMDFAQLGGIFSI